VTYEILETYPIGTKPQFVNKVPAVGKGDKV
jgi:sarcosine oxidase subunit delta